MSAGEPLFYAGQNCTVIMGGCHYLFSVASARPAFSPIVIDGEAFIRFDLVNGDLALSLTALNENGDEVLVIRRNVLRVNNAIWDYERVGQRLKLSSTKRNVILDITFRPPDTVVVRRARIFRNRIEFAVLHDFNVLVNNATVFRGTSMVGIQYGVVIGAPMPDAQTGIYIGSVPREPVDREDVIRTVRRRMREYEEMLRSGSVPPN
jgi:hypothetical protein